MKRAATAALSTLAFVAFAQAAHAGVTFQDVWSEVQTGPYASAPQYQTGYSKFFQNGVNLLAQSADRTLSDQDDLLPRFQKLVHPIGICFSGSWTITEASQYTGYFAKGAQGQIIVRASEALGNPNAGGYRSFGFAGKIFPGISPTAEVPAHTANFFTVDDLGGTKSRSFLDLPKSNAPKTSIHLSQLAIFPTLTEIARVFAAADRDPGIRQVYEISELGLNDPSTAVTPARFQVVPETTTRVNAKDFRDELRLANYTNGLDFGIYVADSANGDFHRLGQIHLDKETLSDGCDHRLHFHHPWTK